ncbi:hypothetical protein FQN57_004760 [Myotisia sp. PD_48]|nr:hypothetical protein FQN57_004760 [Myotisia sp. PD_48]
MKATYVISVLATLCQLAYSQDIRRGPHFIVPYGHPDAPLPLPVGTNRGASPVTPLVIGGEDKIWDLQPVGGGAEDRFTIGQGDRVPLSASQL